MSRITELRIVFAELVLLAAAGLACAATQQPKTRTVVYDAFGFAVSVPQTSVKQMVVPEEPVKLCEAFRYGSLVYLVKVTAVPEEMLTATAIEKSLQSFAAADGLMPGARRWEMEIGGILFKGLAGGFKLSETIPEAAVVKPVLAGKEAYGCMAMAPLGDRFSPIVELWVIGPKSRASEIEDLGRFFVYRFSKSVSKTVPTATTPTSVTSPQRTSVESKRALKKGDIELIGRIEHVESSARTLTLVVERIRMPNTGYIVLDPPRRKTVYLKSAVPELAADDRVRVVGFNTGVGKPMTADIIERL
ncbi:MAG: hypothetical protein QHI38_05645 [Armatimonadota bacterium]|nr:hypothetical protein [Armatimonadota bacterium]